MRKFRVRFDYLNAKTENERRWTTYSEVLKHDRIWEVDRREGSPIQFIMSYIRMNYNVLGGLSIEEVEE